MTFSPHICYQTCSFYKYTLEQKNMYVWLCFSFNLQGLWILISGPINDWMGLLHSYDSYNTDWSLYFWHSIFLYRGGNVKRTNVTKTCFSNTLHARPLNIVFTLHPVILFSRINESQQQKQHSVTVFISYGAVSWDPFTSVSYSFCRCQDEACVIITKGQKSNDRRHFDDAISAFVFPSYGTKLVAVRQHVGVLLCEPVFLCCWVSTLSMLVCAVKEECRSQCVGPHRFFPEAITQWHCRSFVALWMTAHFIPLCECAYSILIPLCLPPIFHPARPLLLCKRADLSKEASGES